MTPRRSWFVVVVDERVSQYAHLFATEWSSAADGEAVSVCNVRPFDHAEDRGSVVFRAICEHTLLCLACTVESTPPAEAVP